MTRTNAQRKYQDAKRARGVCEYGGCEKPLDSKRFCVEHRALHNKRSIESRIAIKHDIIQHYGGKCVCCGEIEEVFLALDHINGGGNKHRNSLKHRSTLYRILQKENYPPGYRILCNNCNWAVAFGRICPHQLRRDLNG